MQSGNGRSLETGRTATPVFFDLRMVGKTGGVSRSFLFYAGRKTGVRRQADEKNIPRLLFEEKAGNVESRWWGSAEKGRSKKFIGHSHPVPSKAGIKLSSAVPSSCTKPFSTPMATA